MNTIMERIRENRVIEISVTDNGKDLPLPSYQTIASAGFDFYAAISDTVILKPGERSLIPTGIRMAIPSDCELQVRPRSGLAAKNGVTVLNSPGTIDSDYRGEIKVILINLGNEPFEITRGTRIAQGILAPVYYGEFVVKDSLDETRRGEGGFGSTGIK